MFLNAEAYAQIGANQTVLNWIKSGVPLIFDQKPPEQFEIKNQKFNDRHHKFIKTEIQDLCASGCVKLCKEKPHCVSPIKCIPKKNKKLRLICDLRQVNDSLSVKKFSNEGINTVASLISPQDKLATVDLKSGFYHVHVNEEHQKYLGFEFDGQYFVWCVLPFGLRCSPYYFYKVLRPVVQYLYSDLGLRVVLHITV